MALPTIISQPTSVTADPGATVTLTVIAAGAPSYTWVKLNAGAASSSLDGGGAYSGNHTRTLTITGLTSSQVGLYGCIISLDGTTDVSTRAAAVLLTGMKLPNIVTQPASQTAAAGATVTFSATVTSADSYQWLYNGSPVGGSSVSGQNSAALTIAGVTTYSAAYYQLKITNAYGTVLSAPAGLTITSGGATTAPPDYPPLGGILLVIPPAASSGTGGGTGVVGQTWTFNGQSAAALGIAGVKRVRRSLDIDTLTFEVPGRAIDADPVFAYGTSVEVSSPYGLFFTGTVTQTPATGTPAGESHAYTLSGPWWHLTHLAARQEWHTPNGVTVTTLSGRLILGQALTGERQTTGTTLTDLLGYAQTCGAPLGIGPILAGYTAPLDEVKDVTIADAIRQVMRWHPNAVGWFDYRTSPPTLSIQAGDGLNPASFTIGAHPLSAVSAITARPDLQVSAVVIHYEYTTTNNGVSAFNLFIDAAPTSATGQELNALCVTIPLRGNTTTSVEQRVETRGIRDDLTADGSDEIRDYLMAFHPDLQKAANDPEITASGITITACSRVIADSVAKKYNAVTGNMDSDDYDSTLDRHLISGGITDWMIANFAIRAQVQRILFDYTAQSGDGTTSAGTKTFTGNSIDLTATNAGTAGDAPVSTPYRTLTNFVTGDAVPSGLAASCYAAFNFLHYSGSVTLIEQEAGSGPGMGSSLNLAGGRAEWQAMNAQTVSEEVDVDTGTTTLTFGPPEHLGPADLVELLKVARPAVGGRASGPAGLSTSMSDER